MGHPVLRRHALGDASGRYRQFHHSHPEPGHKTLQDWAPRDDDGILPCCRGYALSYCRRHGVTCFLASLLPQQDDLA